MADLRRRTKTEDPLVAISGAYVKWALQERNLSVSAAAKQARISQATLHYIVTGGTKRCHSSLREKLAQFLGVDEQTLSGVGLNTWDRIEISPDGTVPIGPSLARVVASHFIAECLKAWQRDIRRKAVPLPRGHRRLTALWKAHPADRNHYVGMALYELLDPAWWSRTSAKLLKTVPPDRPPVSNKQRDETIPGLVALAGIAIGPWLDGTARLNYRNVYALIEEVLASVPWFREPPSKSRTRRRTT